jgi:hypothetical protein
MSTCHKVAANITGLLPGRRVLIEGSCGHRRRQLQRRDRGGDADDAGAELDGERVEGSRGLQAEGGQAADRAAAGRPTRPLEAALSGPGAGPDTGELPADLLLADDLHEPGAAAGGVVDQAGGEVRVQPV